MTNPGVPIHSPVDNETGRPYLCEPLIVLPGDQLPGYFLSPHIDQLKDYGYLKVYEPTILTPDVFVERTQNATVVLTQSMVLTAGIMSQLPSLKLIAIGSVGVDSIALSEARRLGISVANIPGTTAYIVAEHALAMILGVSKGLVTETRSILGGDWNSPTNVLLRGKTLGILGMGPIGTELANLTVGLGMELLCWTFHPSTKPIHPPGVRYVSLETLLRGSDVVVVCLALTEDTYHFIGAPQLALMKPGAFIINVARGPIIDENALAQALNSGQIAGAGLDVFETEPIDPLSPILTAPNTIMTPHSAGNTAEAFELVDKEVVSNVIAFLKGRPVNICN